MNYTLNQLRIFSKITETQSVTKAADELHLTQPAVSIQLKKFQDQFDIPLTEVIGRQMYITDFGMEIAQVARRILEQTDEIRYKMQAYKGELVGQLKVSVVSTGKYVMPYFLTEFLKLNPAVDLQMDVTNKAKVLESLDSNLVDFTMMSILPETEQLRHIPLMQNKLFLVVNPKHVDREKIPSEKIMTSVPLIFREPGSATRKAMEDFLKGHKIPVQKKIELTSNEAVKQAVIAGLGCSITPLIGIRNELDRGDLVIIPHPDLPLKSTWYLVWLKDKKFSPVAKAYLDFVAAEKQVIIDDVFGWFERQG